MKYPTADPQKWVQKGTLEMPKKAWSIGGIQNTKRSVTTVANARFASASSYARKRAGMRWATQSRAIKRENENPTVLADSVPTIESAKATGHGQMSGAAQTNTVPGTPNGWRHVYAARNARYPHGPSATS